MEVEAVTFEQLPASTSSTDNDILKTESEVIYIANGLPFKSLALLMF